jgi:hypothetical protein
MAVNPHRRLVCENVDLHLAAGPTGEVTHVVTASLAYDEKGVLREIVFVSRGKIGGGIDLLLHDLGIRLSRAIQGRPANTELINTGRIEP